MSKHFQVLSGGGVELRPAIFEPPREGHEVYMLVRLGALKTCVPLVHVQPSLKIHFDKGDVKAFDLYRLEQNGPAMRVLAAHPQFLIAAVELKDGRRLVEVPAVLSEQRNRLLYRALALMGIACLGGIMNSMLASAMAASLAGLQLWRRSHVPARAHCELNRQGAKISPTCANRKRTAADSASTT